MALESMRKLLLLVMVAAMAMMLSDAGARRVRMRSKAVAVKEAHRGDTLRMAEGCADSISFSGYDKPAMSDHETFFATNHCQDTLRRLEIEIDYTAEDGRQLHRRTVKTDCDIPPGETRQIVVRSWDKQHSFRYYLSREGRNSATLYKVHLSLLHCWFR